MTTLKDLIIAVKEKNLTKEQLEAYHDQMSSLFAEMNLELAEIEKQKALYFEKEKVDYPKPSQLTNQIFPIPSDISIKRSWHATEKGLREIVLKRYIVATKEMISSLKSRTFRLIY